MIKVLDNKIHLNNHCVGYIYNMVFHKDVESKHFFVMFNGYGISSEVLNWLQQHGIENIEIRSKTKIHRTTVSTYLTRGVEYTDNSKGFEDKQTVLSITMMTVDER